MEESFKSLLPTERFCGGIRGSIVEEAQYLIVVLAHQQNPFTSKSPVSNIFLCGYETGMAKKQRHLSESCHPVVLRAHRPFFCPMDTPAKGNYLIVKHKTKSNVTIRRENV